MDTENASLPSVIADLVTKHIAPQLVELTDRVGDTASVLVLPDGLKAHSIKKFIDEFRVEPERRMGTAVMVDLISFVAHANRFQDADSVLFANPSPTAPTLTSVLDYHARGPIASAAPRFGTHRGLYNFPLSDEWKAWTAMNGKPMPQQAFAEFIENRMLDVIDPGAAFASSAKELERLIGADFATPARLLELSRGLSVNEAVQVRNAVNLGTGEVQVQFVSQHQDGAGAPLRVPGAFLIGLAVFRNGAAYQLAVRLRYRLREGTITWFYEIYRADRAFDDAFKEACEQAREGTKLPLFLGAPE